MDNSKIIEAVEGPKPSYRRPQTRTKGAVMGKHSRKPSKAQKDKTNIELAKYLKRAGIISKQAKLHGGKYISKEVLAKVRKYQNAAYLEYGTVKVSKDIAKAAKERGFEVVQGNRIIGPKTEQFRRRLKSGDVTGVKPVKGGYMEVVQLPHTIYDMRTIAEQLENGIDTLKLPGEQFAFKYKGYESYRAFPNSKALLDYLLHYKGVETALASNKAEDLQEEFEGISIFRLHPNDTARVIPGATIRRKRSDAERQKKNKVYRSREMLSALQLHRVREADRIKKQKQRAAKSTIEKELEKVKARARMQLNRDKKK